jgi:hypothetical protein
VNGIEAGGRIGDVEEPLEPEGRLEVVEEGENGES